MDNEAADLASLSDKLNIKTSLAGSPAAYMRPIIRYWPSFLPGSGFKTQAKIGRDLVNHAINKLCQLFYDKVHM
ncbi:hypothetical protein BDQ17DRAFT_1355050 [Cyathus striatus]|nr:hypothetical protein BDQ17DRAFT_1355050 [Cyathus striatus]